MPGPATDPVPGITRTATDSAGITVPGITRTATATDSRTATDYLGLLCAEPLLGLGILTIRLDIQH